MTYVKHPEYFDNNLLRCYTRCKKIIYNAQLQGELKPPFEDMEEYNKYIDYIVDKLSL